MKKLLIISSLLVLGSTFSFGQQYCILEAAQKQGFLSQNWGKVLFLPIQMGNKKVQVPDSCSTLAQGINYVASLGYRVIAVNNTTEGDLNVMIYTFEKYAKKN